MADELAKQLGLYSHSEGAKFKEMFKADREIKIVNQETGHDGKRMLVSSIYLMLEGSNTLSWHKILSDEMVFWHKGTSMKIYLFSPNGDLKVKILGDPLADPEAAFQQHLPHDHYYAAELTDQSSYILYSEIVAPAFEMSDYIAATVEELEEKYPAHKDLIKRLHKN